MATAKTTVERRTIETKTVTLTLSNEEAETLLALVVKVAGSPQGSPREHTESMYGALRAAGVRDWCKPGVGTVKWDDHPMSLLRGGMTFSDYKEDTA
ncbi:hypothetical protein [Streptomyces sp. NPDC047990]|uniref:hypothetical protein n=1 Tax=Streptomyces sp. NPDC047990 TaxID=3365496 RepID=UPI00371D2B50